MEKQKLQKGLNTYDIYNDLALVTDSLHDDPFPFAHFISSEIVLSSQNNVEGFLSWDPNQTLPEVVKVFRD